MDIAITSPHRQDYLIEASRSTGYAATVYEQYKRDYLGTAQDCLHQGIAFLPVVAETSGGWGLSASSTFKTLARAVAMKTGEEASSVLRSQRQTLGIGIRRANARAIFRRQSSTTDHDDPQIAAELALID